MAFEMEFEGISVDIEYDWDFNRGRTLLRTPQFSDPGFVRLRLESDWNSAPRSGQYVIVEFRDSEGNSTVAQFEQINDLPEVERFINSLVPGGDSKRDVVDVPLESDEILGQYERGSYDNLAPGGVEVWVAIEDRFGNGNVLQGPVTGSFTLGVPSDAKVKENTEIESVSLSADGTTVTPGATFGVLADHGVDLPVTVSAAVGDQEVMSESLVAESLSGSLNDTPESTSVDLPPFELDAIPYQSNEVSYTVAGRGWAARWIGTTTETVQVPTIAADDVEITGCRVTPEQVVAGDQVTVRSSVRNPLPVAITAEGAIDFAGSQATFSQQIGAGEVGVVREMFRTVEPGTAQPTVRLTTVRGNV